MTFPDKKQWIQSTIVVFIFTLMLMAVIFLFDSLVGMLFSAVQGTAN